MFLEFEKEDGGAVAVEDSDVCALGDVRAGLVDVYLRSGPVVRVRGGYASVLRRVEDPYGEKEKVYAPTPVPLQPARYMTGTGDISAPSFTSGYVYQPSRQWRRGWYREDYKDAQET